MGTIGKDFNYKLIKNFISKQEINLLKVYTEIKHRSNFSKFDFNQSGIGATKFYGDPITESLMFKYKSKMEKVTGKKLLPTYSFWRMYTYNADLKKHKDRPSCEISATVNISNDGTKWPIFMDNKPFNLEPGDAAIYLGCEIEHWREKFKGDYNAQVFLHYVDAFGKNTEYLMDKRINWESIK
mgnify:FL=1